MCVSAHAGRADLVEVDRLRRGRDTEEQEEDQSFNFFATESDVSEEGVLC